MQNLMSQAAYARHRGVKPPTVHRYVKKGIILLVGKRVDQIQADKALEETSDPAYDGPSSKGKISYIEARTKKEIARARLNELAVQEKEGTLVIQDDEREKGYAAAQKVKDSLFNIADRLAPLLAVENGETKIRGILMKEFTAICTELSGGEG